MRADPKVTPELSALLSLPLELQSMIWREVVGGHFIFVKWDQSTRGFTHALISRSESLAWKAQPEPSYQSACPRAPPSRLASFYRLNETIYRETIASLYSRNTFHFYGPREVSRFLDSLCARHRHTVEHVVVAGGARRSGPGQAGPTSPGGNGRPLYNH